MTRYFLPTVVFLSIIGFFGYRYFRVSEAPLPIIAVTQIIEHTTLDTVREGMIKRLKGRGYVDGKNIHIIYQNAHGQLATAAQIVQHFGQLEPRVLVALSTQSAQLLQPLSQQHHIPLIFTAVTDPVAAKLVDQTDKPTKGITGVSDYMPPQPQIEMMRKFLPQLKRLGVLYNPSEINSTTYLSTFEDVASKEGITLVRSPLNNTGDAISATRKLIGNVDAIYFPNDNTAMAAVSAIVGIAHGQGVPVFANDEASVQKGALAAVAYNRTDMGYDTADLVIAALKDGYDLKRPTKIGSKISIVINKEALVILGIQQPATLKEASLISNQ